MERKKNKQQKLHVRKGDTVLVLSGNAKGKKATVLEVITKKRRAIVEGVNVVTKHIKPSAAKPDGGIEKTEASIDLSNLMVVDPSNGEATRIGRKMVDGKLVRYSKKTGEVIKNG
jgi:large subunit ribosomal protein L24